MSSYTFNLKSTLSLLALVRQLTAALELRKSGSECSFVRESQRLPRKIRLNKGKQIPGEATGRLLDELENRHYLTQRRQQWEESHSQTESSLSDSWRQSSGIFHLCLVNKTPSYCQEQPVRQVPWDSTASHVKAVNRLCGRAQDDLLSSHEELSRLLSRKIYSASTE